MQYLLLLNEFQTHKLQWPKWPGWFSFQRPSHAWTSSPNCYICPNPNLLHGSEIRIYCRNLKSNSEILASSGLLLDRAAAELSDLFLWSGYALSLYFNPPSSIAFGRGSCTCPYFAVRSLGFYALTHITTAFASLWCISSYVSRSRKKFDEFQPEILWCIIEKYFKEKV